MNDPIQRETVVLGAGIVGICTARYLQMSGVPVTLVDRGDIGDGCSFGNAGVLCTYAAQPAASADVWRKLPGWILNPLGPVSLKLSHLPALLPWLKLFAAAARSGDRGANGDAMFTLNHPSLDLFRQLLAGSGHESLVIDSNYVFATRNRLSQSLEMAEWQERAARGTPLAVLDAEELREMEPDISPDFQGAIAQSGHGRVTNPGRLVKVLGEMVMAEGGEYIQADVRRTAPRIGGGAWLETDRGGIETERLIICAGAFSRDLVKPFGIDVPLQAERGYHMEFRDPGVTVNNAIHDADHKFVTSAMEGGVRCAGTSEFHSLTAKPDWRRAHIMRKLGRMVFPNLNVEDATEWMGHRPAVPDSVPVIGPVPGHQNVILAFGHGTYGLTGAPMTGRLVAGLATNERHNVDMTPYRVDRPLFK
ncbi:MAG: FAD-binding oxidoreductase [Pseudomonadota bacterium]